MEIPTLIAFAGNNVRGTTKKSLRVCGSTRGNLVQDEALSLNVRHFLLEKTRRAAFLNRNLSAAKREAFVLINSAAAH